MAELKATFEIRNDRDEQFDGNDGEPTGHDQDHGPVNVYERRRREITVARELTDAEDAVWAIEASDHEVVWDLWEHLSGEEYDEWGFRSPYPSAEVDVSLNYEISIHDVVWHIAQREEVDPAGVYLSLMHKRRIYGDDDSVNTVSRLRGFVDYCTASGIDCSYWTHGRDGLSNSMRRKAPDEMLEYLGHDPDDD